MRLFGTTFGADGVDCYLDPAPGTRPPAEEGERRPVMYSYGQFMRGAFEESNAEEEDGRGRLDYGFNWLLGLYKDQTPKASAQTITWLDDWLASHSPTSAQPEAQIVARP